MLPKSQPAPGTPQTAPTTEVEAGTYTSIAPNWKVVYHNDDVTTFEFVIGSLMRFFHYDFGRALDLTNEVHHSGAAVVAVLPFEDAEFKR